MTRLVKNTGVVFGALTENEAQLRNLITGSKATFDATASKNDALAETIRIFPTFLKESKLTLARVQTFSTGHEPADHRPAAGRPRPAADAARRARAGARPRAFFRNLDPVITASKTGMPATREVLEGAQPLLGELGPFLSQINPIFKYFEASQWQVADFLNYGAAALSAKTESPGGGTGHYLRQFGPLGAESVAIWKERAPTNRGNSYFQPLSLAASKAGRRPGLRQVQDHGPVRLRRTRARSPRRPTARRAASSRTRTRSSRATSSRSTARSSRARSRTSRPTTTRRGRGASAAANAEPATARPRRRRARRPARSRRARRPRAAAAAELQVAVRRRSGPSALTHADTGPLTRGVGLRLGLALLGDLHAAAGERELVAALGQVAARVDDELDGALEPVGAVRACRARAGRSRRR